MQAANLGACDMYTCIPFFKQSHYYSVYTILQAEPLLQRVYLSSSWQPFVGRLQSVLCMSAEPFNVELEFKISGEKFSVKVEAYFPM